VNCLVKDTGTPNPHGLRVRVRSGAGTGRPLWTRAKPVPVRRVWRVCWVLSGMLMAVPNAVALPLKCQPPTHHDVNVNGHSSYIPLSRDVSGDGKMSGRGHSMGVSG
jgi:hypothetical protein